MTPVAFRLVMFCYLPWPVKIVVSNSGSNNYSSYRQYRLQFFTVDAIVRRYSFTDKSGCEKFFHMSYVLFGSVAAAILLQLISKPA